MGLDMYLSARKRFEKINWQMLNENDELSYNSPDVVYPKFNELMELTQMDNVATNEYGASVEVICAYWRKANQIHKWFVDNVQGGNDNCGEYYVSQEKLKELLDLVKRTLKERNPTLLSPQGGFFFGGTDIDEWYWLGLKNTKEQLERVLNLPQLSDLSFSYSSSW